MTKTQNQVLVGITTNKNKVQDELYCERESTNFSLFTVSIVEISKPLLNLG